jgi:uncharacterized protein (TIGR03437 family)
MDPTVAAKETFTTLKTAAAGEVLRGVALTPAAPSTPMSNTPLVLSAASPGVMALAPGSIGYAAGQNLTRANTEPIVGPLPTTWGDASVSIVDSAGKTWAAPLMFVAPWQVNFQVPMGVAAGSAQVKVSSTAGIQSANNIQIGPVAPAMFTLNGSGLAAGYAVRVSGASQTVESTYALNSFGSFSAAPIDMGSSTDQVYLVLYGSGLQAAGTSGVTATVNGATAQVVYAGPQTTFPGLDQVNLILPSSLAGKGNVNVQITASKIPANPVQITIQ